MSTPTPSDTPKSPWIVDVTTQDFETVVLQRSLELPVVVDFHASWCGPCAELGPALERAAIQADGGFLLAKVDVDANPDLAGAFRVQSIPMVVALAGGRMVDAFQGALPEPELLKFLARIVPDLEAGGGALDVAREALEGGDVDGALGTLEAHLVEHADDLAAHALRAEALVTAERLDEARAALAALTDAQREDDAIKAALARVAVADGAGDLAALRAAAEAAPEDVAARTAYGKALLASQDFARGLEELLEAVRLAPEDKDGEAKQAMLGAFDALGLEDELANRYRFELSLVLFA